MMVSELDPSITPAEQVNGRAAGIILVLSSIITVVFMASHPTVHGHGLADIVTEIASVAVKNRIVHGTLIGTIVITLIGLSGFASRMGMHRMAVRAGLITFAVGTIALIAAAAINGFVVSDLALQANGSDAATLDRVRPLLAMCHVANLACDHIGIFAMSMGVILCSFALLNHPGGSRFIGMFGLIVGILPPVLVATGNLPMNVHGFGAFILAQSIWYIAIAVQMIRGRI